MHFDLQIKRVLLMLVITMVVSCSPKSGYRVLSVFFDGVPDPDISESLVMIDSSQIHGEINTEAVSQKNTELVFHVPYKEKDCGSCHNMNSMGKLTEPMPSLCYQCHENFSEQYKLLHGPVDAGFCTECHNPHQGKNEYLLTRKGQDLCLYCHDPDDVFKGEVHSAIDETDCTECHNPHGGEERYYFN